MRLKLRIIFKVTSQLLVLEVIVDPNSNTYL
jgi:hypothetical protein